MASEATRASRNVKFIKFDIKIDDIEDLETFCSGVVYVRGVPWVVELSRYLPNTDQDSLAVVLSSTSTDAKNTWAIVAEPSVKIITSKETKKLKCFGRVPFTSSSLWWMEKTFISWKELMDPKKGYLTNGACKFEVDIEAGPLQDNSTGEWLKLETIRKCDKCSKGEYRLTVLKFDEFYGVITSPLVLRNINWRIFLRKGVKTTNNNDGTSENKYLQIDLHYDLPDNQSHKAVLFCELLSNSLNNKSVEFKMVKNVGPEYQTDEGNLISWDILTNPKNRFISNNSFVVEINLSIDPEVVEASNKGDSKRLECPICFVSLNDQSLSSPQCGHVFCTTCLHRSVQQKPVCPTCKKSITTKELKAIYLPFK